MKFGASILTLDYGSMKESIEKLNTLPLDYYHLDVMDGCFVPQLTFGSKMIRLFKDYGTKFIDAHLMAEKPERMIESLALAGADNVTFHIEAVKDAYSVIRQIKETGMQAGVAVSPGTSIYHLDAIAPEIDLVLQMSVVPGFGGQKLIPATLENVARLNKYRAENGLSFEIQMDGGINLETVKACQEAGADSLVLGSSLVDSRDWQESYHEIVSLTG